MNYINLTIMLFDVPWDSHIELIILSNIHSSMNHRSMELIMLLVGFTRAF